MVSYAKNHVYGVIIMDSSVAYIFAIVFIVLALNIYFITSRMKRSNRPKRMNRAAVEEAKQALWRDKEIARRIEREQDDALERVKLRNETLAIYDEVRKRAAARDSEGAIIVKREMDATEDDNLEMYR